MSTKSSPQTQTTVAEPPAHLRPYLQQAAQGSQQLYGQGGTPVTGFSPQTQQALSLTEQRALAGSPVTAAAQQYATRGLTQNVTPQSFGMNPNANVQNPYMMGGNPHLDQTFNRAALATQNQLASQFGRSGRNASESQHLRSEQLGNLANTVYGGAYESDAQRRYGAGENLAARQFSAGESMMGRDFSGYQSERDRQQQLVPYAGQLAANDYADIGQLAQVGAQHEDLARQYAGAPGQALDEYLARLQGYQGGTSTSVIPQERNRLAGAAGGAMTGAMFGPWGALIGGGLGALYG